MLDPKFIREHTDAVREELNKRNYKLDLDAFLALDEKRRAFIAELDFLRAQHNVVSEKVRTASGGERDELIAHVRAGKESLGSKEQEYNLIERLYQEQILQFPNISHESVPVGFDETGNVVVKKAGIMPEFDFEAKEHYEVKAIQPLIDFERGAKISGNRFWFLKGALARLDIALMHYALDFYASKGFTPMVTPMLVREAAMVGTGFFPADRNEIYSVNKDEDDMYLIGTAEVPLAGYHMNEVVDLSQGPLTYAGISSCFRREAGSYGKDLKGILRGHQFQKVEMFVFCEPEQSWEMHEFLLACAEEFFVSLGFHYQVLNMCAGDIGSPNAKKYDIEVWMPGQKRYREVASDSNDTDFQARRLNTKYVAADGKKKYVHTLNNTGCPDLRTLIAIIENYQQKDGSVRIPEVLRPYCGFDSIS